MPSEIPIDTSELPGMIATLCSYDSLFGPHHPHTLHLMVLVADGLWRTGEPEYARSLLERVVRDSNRCPGPGHDLRLRAMTLLRDLLIAEHDQARASAVQRELLECQIRRPGNDHSEMTAATQAYLTAIPIEKVT